MTSSPESHEAGGSAAARWFDARLVPEQLSRMRYLGRAVRWVFGEATPLFWLQDILPKVGATVEVFRRADGFTVKEFDYDSQHLAAWHVANLQDRLPSTQVFDFCRELGIDINHVRE